MGAIKEHSNQIIKILICLCLTFVFIFVQPKENAQQAEAIVPLLVPLGYLVAGVVAETALEMGIKHLTSSGKTTKGSKTKRVADAVLGNLGDYDFDNTNPTRMSDGSLSMNMSANDRAKIARKIADEFGDVLTSDDDKTTNIGDGDVSFDVTQNGPGIPSENAQELVTKLIDFTFTPNASTGKYLVVGKSIVTGAEMVRVEIPSGRHTYPVTNNYINTSTTYTTPQACFAGSRVTGLINGNMSDFYTTLTLCDVPTVRYYQARLKVKELAGAMVYTAGGMVVPSTLRNVYSAGEDMDDAYLLPNNQELSNKPYVVKNIFPPSTSDEDVTWEVVQNHYDNDLTVKNKFEDEIGVYLENGDLNKVTNNYTTQTINNYYTDTTYPVKNDDIKNDIDIIIDNEDTVIVPGGTDVDVDADGFKYCVDKSSGQVVPCKDIEAIDGGLLSYVRDSYNYAVNAVKTAVNGLETIATGSVGLIALYSEIFDWLPDEVTVLLTSGLMLMIGLRVFRK